MPKKRLRRTRDGCFSGENKPIDVKPTIKQDVDPIPSTDDDESSKSSSSYTIVTRKRLEEQLPVASRTKNANKASNRSMRFISLDIVDGKESVSLRSGENTKTRFFKRDDPEPDKKRSMKDLIHETVEEDMNDPDLKRMLKKIAYCRVFTNYLFRQYDMLSIDFQLYSNLDDLMVDLKRRVGAYSAIRRSRMQILQGDESNSTREGSTG